MTRAVKKVTEVTEVILVIKDINDSDTNDYENVSGWMKYEKNRRGSFDPIWLEHYQLNATFAHELAEAGFYCVLEGGDSVCFSCGLRKSSFFWGEHSSDPNTFHRKESPNCEFITGHSDNVPIGSEQQNHLEFVKQIGGKPNSGTAQVPQPTKHPEYESESKRRSTFVNLGLPSAEILWKAGFFYAGEYTVGPGRLSPPSGPGGFSLLRVPTHMLHKIKSCFCRADINLLA